MHELPVIKEILRVCLKHAAQNAASRIVSIDLAVGGLCELEPEWMQRYFDFASAGGLAEGAKLKIWIIPVLLRCERCSRTFETEVRTMAQAACPSCGSADCPPTSGREYFIRSMEVV